ncbi:MAG TPA: hypothetical protein V6D23_25255 [Candidatus Obscuribacterales bacterium]
MQRFRRFLIGSLLCLSLLPLQGCLLDYFFAPKIAAGELPQDPAMESLRSAYITQCGRCHLLVAPRYYNRERPINKFTDRYFSAKIITQQEADEVATYIRALAARPLPPTSSPTPEPDQASPLPVPSDSPGASPSPATSPTASASPEPSGSPVVIPSPSTSPVP